jgi:hypothetical protein
MSMMYKIFPYSLHISIPPHFYPSTFLSLHIKNREFSKKIEKKNPQFFFIQRYYKKKEATLVFQNVRSLEISAMIEYMKPGCRDPTKNIRDLGCNLFFLILREERAVSALLSLL